MLITYNLHLAECVHLCIALCFNANVWQFGTLHVCMHAFPFHSGTLSICLKQSLLSQLPLSELCQSWRAIDCAHTEASRARTQAHTAV